MSATGNLEQSPEIGSSVATAGYLTNYHDHGAGDPVVLLHGSGAGVSGWANWRGQIPVFAEHFRVLAPDLIGFGYTERPAGYDYRFMDSWVEQMLAFFDALALPKVDLVGNSFGGSLSLALAVRAPERIRRIVLMGSGGVREAMTPELEELWGYTPSVENMKKIMQIMAFDQELVTTELAEMRYRASLRPGVQETFERLFPPPRQRWLDAQVQRDGDLRALTHQVLIVHGREDRVVPRSGSLKLMELIPNAQLHIFGKCGHWTMIEQRDRFNRLVVDFLSER